MWDIIQKVLILTLDIWTVLLGICFMKDTRKALKSQRESRDIWKRMMHSDDWSLGDMDYRHELEEDARIAEMEMIADGIMCLLAAIAAFALNIGRLLQ